MLAEGRAFNAIDVAEALGCSAEEVDQKWDATKGNGRVKFGGGFYCALIDPEKKIYTFNAFFMSMRKRFTEPGSSIHYFTVEFDPKTLSWADFRGKVLGPTDPASAPESSLRGVIHREWKRLGLSAPPDTGNNGVHASASPFEGFAERANWLGVAVGDDTFGRALLQAGMSEQMIRAWMVDPQVTLEVGGGKGSLFDQLEDLDVEPCLAKCAVLAKL